MSTQLVCFPRLSLPNALEDWAAVRELTVAEMRDRGDAASVAGAEFYPMAMSRCTDEDLRELRQAVVSAATQRGYPSTSTKDQRREFDKAASRVLYDFMKILPSDAANAEVWTFINLRLLPDIAMWRFGRQGTDGWEIAEERLFSKDRTVFGRLWWRACLLGPELSEQFAEDLSVQLMERPKISGYPPLARSIAKRFLRGDARYQSTQFLRDVMKRFTRSLAVISVFQMSQDQMDSFVDDVFLEGELAINFGPSN